LPLASYPKLAHNTEMIFEGFACKKTIPSDNKTWQWKLIGDVPLSHDFSGR